MTTELDTKLDMNNPVHATVKERLLQLETALLNKDPMMRNHLAEIHKAMVQHEELVHLLTNDELEKLMRAQQAHTNTILAAEKPKKAATAKAAKLSLSDL